MFSLGLHLSLRSHRVPTSGGNPATLPAAPTNFTAQGLDSHSHLLWDAVEGVLRFKVYRTATADVSDAVLLGEITDGTLELDDYTGTNGQQYTFFVRSVNAAGESENSNTYNATPYHDDPPPTDPTVPANVLAIPFGHGVLVQWDASERADWYKVYRNDVLVEGEITGLQLLDNDLDLNTIYEYKVFAGNATNVSDLSSLVSAYPGTYAPTSLALSYYINTPTPAIVVHFTPSSDGAEYGHLVEYSLAGAESWNVADANATSPVTIGGLNFGTAYDVRARTNGLIAEFTHIEPSPVVQITGLITPTALPQADADFSEGPHAIITWSAVAGAVSYTLNHYLDGTGSAPIETHESVSSGFVATLAPSESGGVNTWTLIPVYDSGPVAESAESAPVIYPDA